jgi:V/A-type H+-transporting ATPase subunit A
VSPPGGDLSDSVVQATLHVVKVFWSLQARLAQQRHFPAIDWLTSYSFYKQYLKECFDDRDRAEHMDDMIAQAMQLLEQESSLVEIVRLVGAEAIGPKERMALETAKSIREDYLHQNAFHKIDTFTSLTKQYLMLRIILHFHAKGIEAIERDIDTDDIFKLKVRDEIGRCKYIPEEELQKLEEIEQRIDKEFGELK